MKAINRYIIVDKIKTEPKKVAGLIMTDDTDVDNRYIKAKIISCGHLVEGLKDGDCWCVCAIWFKKAVDAGYACKIFLKSTNKKTLEIVSLETLKKHAIDLA